MCYNQAFLKKLNMGHWAALRIEFNPAYENTCMIHVKINLF